MKLLLPSSKTYQNLRPFSLHPKIPLLLLLSPSTLLRPCARLLLLNHLRRRIPNTSRYIHQIPNPTTTTVGTIFSPRRSLHQAPNETRNRPHLASSLISTAETETKKVAAIEEEEDELMNEFLSHFVWKIRKKIRKTYPKIDCGTCDWMLLVITQKVLSRMERSHGGRGELVGLSGLAVALAEDPTLDLNLHLWMMAWDLSGSVLEDMRKNRKRELMKWFLHSEDVKG